MVATGNLKTHIRSVHTKEKPFACPICGKSFSQKGNMQTHVRTHNKQHRYPCTLCGKTYSQKGKLASPYWPLTLTWLTGNLKTHLQRHEDRTGQVTSPLCEPASDALATLSSDDDSCHSPPRHAPDAQSHPGPAGRGDNPACALPSPPAHCWPAHKTTQRNPVDMTSHSPYHSLSSLATQAYGSLAAAQVTSPLCRLSLFGPTGSALDSLRSLGSLIKGSEHWH